ncbi:TIGR03751 family conjugal transfer lipoprotein [Pasteurella atlantica]|uniref:TIGR03751 family conjugal transfer lipoprotein n=2 Tax=Pasteurellaceae TaxID=712 RepID=A0ACC6HL51_9PAST|nr:TIGR03751 family conjugal transfer lipoprotein [Pasteurella atlantica]MDP8051514.1 TIGR03751 family conjugal transfer lipoprotein [Pasteurella atlantica]MDP8104907.1 TIGR03751 family conjugal transfer lipoprotein [Pasteurella atlantica]MDP8148281.1 TIGR03751 family conjugal transfer lipoprotein [Pasteurella atlantica]
MKKYYAIFILSVTLVGCSTQNNKQSLLPDSGANTLEIIKGSNNTDVLYGEGQKSSYKGEMILPSYHPSSYYSDNHINELKRDFKKVPNPEIIGYIYPHLNNNQFPIPGYFTIFNLYDKTHFALNEEGYNE